MQDIKKTLVIQFYITANGVLEITKFMKLIKNTGLNITKTELIKKVKELGCIIKDDLIYLDSWTQDLDNDLNMHENKKENKYKVFTLQEMLLLQFKMEEEKHEERIAEELIEEMTPTKNTLKQYKIVEDVDKEVDEFWNTGDRIAEALLKYDIDGEISTSLFQLMQMGGIPEEMLDEILKEKGFNLSHKKIKELSKELSIIQKDVRIWSFNGFKKSELTNLNKKEKIGRNSPCPCGSGKKYKQCCGK